MYFNTTINTFVSIEPLLEKIDIDAIGNGNINWVIIGAETGNRKNKVVPKREWVEDIVRQCRMANVPVFMKNSLAPIWGVELIQDFPWE